MMNTDPRASQLMNTSERVYRALLILYPAAFRREYGRHMTQVFRDLCRDAVARGGRWGLVNCWAAALLDLLKSVITEHRKVDIAMSKAKFIQSSGWFCLLGGVLFVASSLSQLQPGSFLSSDGLYRASILALVPGMIFITLGLLGLYLRLHAQMNFFGKLSLLTALIGAGVTSVAWMLTVVRIEGFYSLFIVGWMVHLIGMSVFGGYATTDHLLPRWNVTFLIGSGLPLAVIVIASGALQRDPSGVSWGMFAMLLLMGISWILTGLVLNSGRIDTVQPAPAS
ncbi:MAG: hypothetical protein SGI73_21980 [Chloroflexota bacterium]|nr:hypothetical protein [Chloroflexota bacterium]